MVTQAVGSESFNEFHPHNRGAAAAAATERPFQRILLATDFSRASREALPTALDMCKTFNATLVILHVFEYADCGTWPADTELVELPRLMGEAKTRLQEAQSQAARAGVRCEGKIQCGSPTQSIEDFIANQRIDMVIMGTSALHGFERLLFGSTAEALMRKSSVPVLIVGPRADAHAVSRTDRPVIFATDFHMSTVSAVGLAATISRATASPLHCLHVLPRSLEGASDSHIIPSILSEALQQMANQSGLAVDHPICATTFGSEVSNAVVQYAREHHAKLIVLGVRQASLAASHTAAHIAFRIVTEASCPVLTMSFDSSPENHLAASAACIVA
jgi:nucleotide-binding universal stress UspA family protein